MSKTFRNHLIFAILAAIVFVVFVAMFMSTLFNSVEGDWVIDLFLKSYLKVLFLTYMPLLFAAESFVYAIKFILETCLCYKKTKLIKWLNVANLMASALIFVAYAFTFKIGPAILNFIAYTWISYVCVAVIVGVGIASIVLLALSAKKAKEQIA